MGEEEHETGIVGVTRYISTNGLPELRELDLTFYEYSSEEQAKDPQPGQLLMTALCAPGVAPKLQTLRLRGLQLAGPSSERLAEAIKRKAWPDLKELSMRDAGLRARDVEVLVQAIVEAGGCPGLTTLDLSHSSLSTTLGDEAAGALAAGLTAAACPSLTELDLSCCGIQGPGIKALADALLPRRLQRLALGGEILIRDGQVPGSGDEGVHALVEALKAGAGIELTELNLVEVGMSKEGLEALIEVIEDQGACPNLSVLECSPWRYGMEEKEEEFGSDEDEDDDNSPD